MKKKKVKRKNEINEFKENEEIDDDEEKEKGSVFGFNLMINTVFVLFVLLFLFSLYQIWGIYHEYKIGYDEYAKIKEEAVQEIEVSDSNEEIGTESETDSTENGSEKESDEEVKETRVALNVDFEQLQSINSDIIGWIYFEEPSVINYPIVAGIDNTKYLKRTFEGTYNSAGTLFTDMSNATDFNDRNTFIYGHNMKNGTMFGQLRKYKSLDYRNEHPYFYIYTPDGREIKYEIFAACIVNDGSASYDKMYATDNEFLLYLNDEIQRSLYKTDVKLGKNSSIVSLSTCTNVTQTERLLVHAVKVEEKIIN